MSEPAVYPSSAMEREMKVQEVMLRAIDGRLKWYQAAEILGISDRQMRRWLQHGRPSRSPEVVDGDGGSVGGHSMP